MPKILIDSALRTNQSQSNVDFDVDLDRAQQPSYKSVTLHSAHIPLSWHNVSATGAVDVSGLGSSSVEISARFPTIDILTFQLESSFPGSTFSANAATGRITVHFPGTPDFSLTRASGDLWSLLGASDSQIYSGGNAIVFDNPHKLYQSDRYLQLSVGPRDITRNDAEPALATFLLSLPSLVDREFGETIALAPESSAPVAGSSFDRFRVQLRDRDGEFLDLHNLNWDCVISLD